jgi:hypothetical protein
VTGCCDYGSKLSGSEKLDEIVALFERWQILSKDSAPSSQFLTS